MRNRTRTFKKPFSYGIVALTLLAIEVCIVIFAHQIAPYSPTRQFFGALLQPPSGAHLLGTDSLGQDVLSQVIFGGRTSLILGFVVMVSSGLGGTILGMLCSTPRRDFWIMRLVDALISFPPILIALAIIGAVGSGLGKEIIVISIAFVPYTARVVRGEVLRLRNMVYVEAAQAAGANELRVAFRHFLPNAMPAILAQLTYVFARAIVLDAALGYLGLGVPPPTPTWGTLIANSQPYLANAWWAWLAPSTAIVYTTIIVNLVGRFLNATGTRNRFSDTDDLMVNEVVAATGT